MTTRARTTAEVEAGARAIHAMDCTIWGDEMVGSWEAGDDKHIYRAEAEACLAAADAAAPANRVREIKTLEFPYTDADFADAAPAVGVTVDAVRQAFKDILLPFVDAIAWDVDPESVNGEGNHVPSYVVNRGDIELFAMGFGTEDWPRVLARHPYLDPEEWPNLDALLTAQPEPGTGVKGTVE